MLFNKFKNILILGLVTISILYSQNEHNVDEYKELTNTKNIKDMSKFQYLEQGQDVSKYKYLLEKRKSVSELTEMIDKGFITDTPEYKYLKELNEKMKNGEINNTAFFFLYSESMPIENIIRFSQHITLIQRYDPTARGYVVFRGISGIETTINRLKQEIDSPFFDYSEIAKNIRIKLDPRFFQKLKVKKVPITILAKCTNKNIFDNCEFKFTQKGSLSLINFLNDVNLVDPENYGKYYNYVISPD